jgi:hypothetical protein
MTEEYPGTDTYSITAEDEATWLWFTQGPMQGAVSIESIRKGIAAAEQAEKINRDKKLPPKPPKAGHAAGIGRLALGNT